MRKINILEIWDNNIKNGFDKTKTKPIPYTPLWLFSRYKDGKYDILIGNPLKTYRRLVTSNITEEDFQNYWKLLSNIIDLDAQRETAQRSITELTNSYKKAVAKHYKNNKNHHGKHK